MSQLFESFELVGLAFCRLICGTRPQPPSFLAYDRFPHQGFQLMEGQPAQGLHLCGVARGETNTCPSDIGAVFPECLVLIGKK